MGAKLSNSYLALTGSKTMEGSLYYKCMNKYGVKASCHIISIKNAQKLQIYPLNYKCKSKNILSLINLVEVASLKKLFLSFFVIAFIFTFNVTALADKGHSDDSQLKQATDNFRKGTNTEQKEHSDGDTHQESGDDHGEGSSTSGHTETEAHRAGTDQDENHSDAEGDHSSDETDDGHHGPVVEAPPNYKVLGSFGVVNLSFILIGVWNKWFRRKGNI
jgi:hypothetical protein